MEAEDSLADRYVLERRLASGGMGEVWLARDAVLGREVAVKVLAVDSGGDPEAVERFRREARTMATLEHPNIVTIFDSGTHQGSAFIVMELLSGPTVAQLVAGSGPLGELEAVGLGAQIAAGLAAAHQAGVVHRDIKPSNLMFSSSGALKIVDFGIARLSQNIAPALTATNAVIGSAPYLSPEQAVGAPADERSDLYSLGCVLVTMVTGRPPFTGEHPMSVLHQHVNTDPPLLSERQPEVSSALEALVGQLLSKRSDARPASANEVEDRLNRILAARKEPDRTATATLVASRAQETKVMKLAATREYPTMSRPTEVADPHPGDVRLAGSAMKSQRRSWWLIAAAVVAVVLAALVLMPLLSSSGDVAGTSPASATPNPTTSTATPAPAKTTPQVATTELPTSPLANLRAVVAEVVADGQMEPRKADEFGRRLDALAKKPDDRKKGGSKQVDDLSRYLNKLVKSGELTPDGFRRIEAALVGV